MRLSSERKREILLESFNVLKGNYANNSSKLQEIIHKMFSIDSDTAIEMWIYLLNTYKNLIKDSNESYGLTEGIIYNTSQSIGYAKIGEIIVGNDFLKKVVFRQSANVCLNTMEIIRNYIYSRNLVVVNELIDLVYKNKNNREYSFGGYLEKLIDYIDKDLLTDEALNLLLSWAEKVKDHEEKAKINVALLNLTSDE